MVPSVYDVSRERTSKLRQLSLAKDSRNVAANKDEPNKVSLREEQGNC